MVDLQAEKLSFADVAGECDVHVSTVWRWTMKGVRGVKLRSVLIGGRAVVTRDDLTDFLSRLNSGRSGSPSRPSNRAVDANRRAEAELDRAGIV